MPMPPKRNPPDQQPAATTPTFRGPTSSSHLPAMAAESPRNTIATVNTHTTLFKVQSSAALVTTPTRLIKTGLNRLHA